jgi:hypothetical protein
LLVFWLAIGLPGVAGYGFSGGDIEIPTDPVGLLL